MNIKTLPDSPDLKLVTDLTLEEVKRRLREVILVEGEHETSRHQFSGNIEGDEAYFQKLRAGRYPEGYSMTFGIINNQTHVAISNGIYSGRILQYSMVKAVFIPIGFIVLILGCVLFQNWQQLLITTGISAIILTLSILYKVKPLSQEEYLNDPCIREIIKTIKGRAV